MPANEGSLPAFLEDGYTVDFAINPAKGLHGGLKGKFRPALDRVRCDYRRKTFANGAEEDAYLSAVIAKHVESWEGRAKVDEEGARRLHPDIRRKLIDQLLGYEPSEGDSGN